MAQQPQPTVSPRITTGCKVGGAGDFCYDSLVMMLSMPRRARQALELYLNQEPRRSLSELAKVCAEGGILVSVPTLKRWSARFSWQRLVIQYDREAERESRAKTADRRIQALTERLLLIDYAKERYDWLIDPEKADLTPAQRRRANNVTLSDFLRILKLEIEAVKSLSDAPSAHPPTAEELRQLIPEEAIRAGVKAARRKWCELGGLRAENKPLRRHSRI